MTIFDAIKQKLSIVEVISNYVSLKKAGIYWKGRCPFHSEKTPSFTVSPHKNIFYCFGCRASGDIIGFIAQIEQYSQLEAAQELIKRYQLPIETIQDDSPGFQQLKQKQRFFSLNDYITHWCTQSFEHAPDAKAYLEHRAITQDTIKKFYIGFWPAGPKAIAQLVSYIKKYNFSQEDLIKNGFLYRSSYGLRSAFENRIIFPIRDYLGNICGFGGRIFKKDDTRVKYYNSREHYYFNKGSLLYGLDVAKKAIAKSDHAFIVEGYTDVLALAQQGYTNTVATLGTACTHEHLELLSRYTKKIYLTFDGDAAGTHALMSIVDKCWNLALDPFVVQLPEKDDPATMLAKKISFKEYHKQAQDIFTFFVKQRALHLSQANLSEKLQAIKDILLLIKQIPDSLKQDILLHKAAEVMNISLNQLQESLKKITAQAPMNSKSESQNAQIIDTITLLEKKLFAAILTGNSSLAATDIERISHWLSKPLDSIAQKIVTLRNEGQTITYDTNQKYFSSDEQHIIHHISIEIESTVSDDMTPIIKEFYKKQWKIVLQEIKLDLQRAERARDIPQIQKLLKKLTQFKQEMAEKGIV